MNHIMTDTEIRAAIAEACGWERVNGAIGIPPKDADNQCFIGGSNDWAFIPDYCENLNAMNQAEKMLNSDQQVTYFSNLRDILASRHYLHLYFDVATASARQRAEAFIKTVCPEKWKESP